MTVLCSGMMTSGLNPQGHTICIGVWEIVAVWYFYSRQHSVYLSKKIYFFTIQSSFCAFITFSVPVPSSNSRWKCIFIPPVHISLYTIGSKMSGENRLRPDNDNVCVLVFWSGSMVVMTRGGGSGWPGLKLLPCLIGMLGNPLSRTIGVTAWRSAATHLHHQTNFFS